MLVGDALADVVKVARGGYPQVRVGLMAGGSELGAKELLDGAALAASQDPRLQVVAIGARQPGYDALEWIETPEGEGDMVHAMESALADGRIQGAVALHYPLPVGVATIGRVLTPARGRPLLIASCTGISATARTEAMVRNAVYGIAVAKALGLEKPSVGILNLDGAASVQRALQRLADNGYDINFGSSGRADGGSLLRGTDLLAGSTDVCVCDSLTGNVIVKLLSAMNSGGEAEVLGWGYGPAVGDTWERVVSIVSRVSGAPVIANALCYAAAAIRGGLVRWVRDEIALAETAGLADVIASSAVAPAGAGDVVAPLPLPIDAEIYGVDVLAIDAAVKELWKAAIYAESSMGCTGPVIRVPASFLEKSRGVLNETGYL
jgi:glycine/sarcosine/betaine reductase complex component C subunit alpha